MHPEPAVLLSLSNTQMSGPYGNLLPDLLTAIQGYMWWGRVPFSRNSYKVDILGKEAITRNTEGNRTTSAEKGRDCVCTTVLSTCFCLALTSAGTRAFQLQMYQELTTTCLTAAAAADNPAYLAISKIQRVCASKWKVYYSHIYLWWSQSVCLSWCRCDTEIKEHSEARYKYNVMLNSIWVLSPSHLQEKRHIKYL